MLQYQTIQIHHDEDNNNYENNHNEIPFYESQHGRLRREQRGIDKKDLQDAMRYGQRTCAHPDKRNGHSRSKYVHNGIVYVVDDVTGQEITSWASPLVLDHQPISQMQYEQHMRAVQCIQRTPAFWESNTVVVVDTSGSMRGSDVWGARTRLSAVWISLALDFVAHRIETGACGGDKDVVSIVLMGETARVVLKEQPVDWVLYNTLIDVYNEKISEKPKGHGYYIPSLQEARRLLEKSQNSSCSLDLHFLSDGRPSDHKSYEDDVNDEDMVPIINGLIKEMACKFGPRLTVSTVGIGNPNDFVVLDSMANIANTYGARGFFQLPSLTSSALGAAFNTIASSITVLDNAEGRKQNLVRALQHEPRSDAIKNTLFVDNQNYRIFSCNDVIRKEYDPTLPGQFKTVPLQHPNAMGVAMKRLPFGEGAERFAFQFFELASDYRTIVGEPLVAKESRFFFNDTPMDNHSGVGSRSDRCSNNNTNNWHQREKFVKTFCSAQQQARIVAEAFNAKLDAMPNLDPFTARVSFVNCSVYYINDKDMGKIAVLVEPKLDPRKFQKWNNNYGGVYGEGKKEINIDERVDDEFERSLRSLSLDFLPNVSNNDRRESYKQQKSTMIRVTPGEVAQAFSHFSYTFTKKTRLICDLQGEYDEAISLFKFTDPVIHYHNCMKEENTKVYGRSDKGRKGIQAFMCSHRCNALCRLVTQGYSNGQQKVSQGRRYSLTK